MRLEAHQLGGGLRRCLAPAQSRRNLQPGRAVPRQAGLTCSRPRAAAAWTSIPPIGADRFVPEQVPRAQQNCLHKASSGLPWFLSDRSRTGRPDAYITPEIPGLQRLERDARHKTSICGPDPGACREALGAGAEFPAISLRNVRLAAPRGSNHTICSPPQDGGARDLQGGCAGRPESSPLFESI